MMVPMYNTKFCIKKTWREKKRHGDLLVQHNLKHREKNCYVLSNEIDFFKETYLFHSGFP